MHSQLLSRNVTSKTHVRSSSASSNETHSWVLSATRTSSTRDMAHLHRLRQLWPQFPRGQQTFPELVHHHALVGRVDPVVGQTDAEEEHRRVEHPAQCLLGTAPALAGEQ